MIILVKKHKGVAPIQVRNSLTVVAPNDGNTVFINCRACTILSTTREKYLVGGIIQIVGAVFYYRSDAAYFQRLSCCGPYVKRRTSGKGYRRSISGGSNSSRRQHSKVFKAVHDSAISYREGIVAVCRNGVLIPRVGCHLAVICELGSNFRHALRIGEGHAEIVACHPSTLLVFNLNTYVYTPVCYIEFGSCDVCIISWHCHLLTVRVTVDIGIGTT